MAKKPTKRTTKKKVQDSESLPPPIPHVDPKPENDDDDPVGDDGLTIRRREFVRHITTDAFGNATKAAKLAGYSDSNRHVLENTASRLLGFVGVQQAIARELARRRMTPDDTVLGIAELAGTSMAHFLQVGPDGSPVMNWPAAAAAGAIGQIIEYHEDGIDGAGGPVVIKRKFKTYSRLRALELMAKVQGLLSENVNHVGTLTVRHEIAAVTNALSDPATADLADQLAERLAPRRPVQPGVAGESSN